MRLYIRKLKQVYAYTWIYRPPDRAKTFAEVDLSHLNIKYHGEVKQTLKREVQQASPKPISPILGPLTLDRPKIHDKIYRWCACGMSLKQPLCDGSHKGSAFKPFKFTIEYKVNSIQLCGCKLSTNKPFCDGNTCHALEDKNLTQYLDNVDAYTAARENQKKREIPYNLDFDKEVLKTLDPESSLAKSLTSRINKKMGQQPDPAYLYKK